MNVELLAKKENTQKYYLSIRTVIEINELVFEFIDVAVTVTVTLTGTVTMVATHILTFLLRSNKYVWNKIEDSMWNI